MAYPPATRLMFTSSSSEKNWAIVLSDNNVKCLSGTYKGETMKLIDWLILAGGKECAEECYEGEAAAVWKHAQTKAGLLNDSKEAVAQKNLAHAGAMWMVAQEKYAEDIYSRHN